MENDQKEQAFEFLKELEKALNKALPSFDLMVPWIRHAVSTSKANGDVHLRHSEAAFLNGQVLPVTFKMLCDCYGLTQDEARTAILNEYWRSMPHVSKSSPMRHVRHPFQKRFNGNAAEVYRDWFNPEAKGGLTTSSPDFALRTPFPHPILFEGKFFSTGKLGTAQPALVRDIYQVSFYRGLPPVSATKRHPEWGYDYACLIAYDASSEGYYLKAWTDLPPITKKSFWESSNVYVMILRGSGG